MRTMLALALASLPATAWAGGDDPAEQGPYEVQVDTYDFGDQGFPPDNFTIAVEFRGAVYSPVALDEGPFPLVILLHGRHLTCFDPLFPTGQPGDGSFNGGFFFWPCPDDMEPVPSYLGYEETVRTLASHGYIVVSVSAGGIAPFDNNFLDGGAQARAELLIAHLNLWADFNATDAPPMDGKFNGAVDVSRVGLVGHSRGGEGVARMVEIDQELGSPVGVDAILLVAPTDFDRHVLPDVALGVVLPYCDGDVSNLEGVHYFDDARYVSPGDTSPKHTFTIFGANHNFFNTAWTPLTHPAGSSDDFTDLEQFLADFDPVCGATSAQRLSEAEQRLALTAYASAFFRTHLGGETQFEAMLRGDENPASVSAAPVFSTRLAPDDPSARLDVNRLDTEASLRTNTLGQPVTVEGATYYDLCGLTEFAVVDNCIDDVGVLFGGLYELRQPHTPGMGQLRMGLGPGGRWSNALPAGTDVSALTHVQVRAAIDFEVPPTDAGMEIALTDADGNTASVAVPRSAIAPALGTMYPVLPKKLLNAVRVPLSEFVGVDLTDLATIDVHFTARTGNLMLADLAFTDALPEDPGGSSTGDSTGTLDDTGDSGEAGTTAAISSSSGLGTTDADEDSTGSLEDDEAGGCGCRQHRGAHGGWLIALVLLALRASGSRNAGRTSSRRGSSSPPCTSAPCRSRT